MKQRVRELIESGDKLFSQRKGFESHWQDIARNFYPERADFTTKLSAGEELASDLMSGRPVMARRDLGNSLSAMLRPRGQDWFKVRTDNETINKDVDALRWLDWATEVMTKLMYSGRGKFVRATKQGDHDFITFGQCVLTVDLLADRTGIIYRPWHLRDTAWSENAEQVVDTVHRKWCLEARSLAKLFNGKVSSKVTEAATKEPYREIKCRHIVLPKDDYDYDYAKNGKVKRDYPFISIYVDTENDHILEELPVNSLDYVIPRWVQWPGTQYGVSPAVVTALPDARMLQQIGLTLLEAGQKAVDPPLIAVGEVVSGGINLQAGGVSFIDPDYDERTGEAIRPLPIDTRGLNWGVDREDRCAAMIAEAFMLNKITLPPLGASATATEIQHRYSEYIRQALPLFEPIETEYIEPLCDKTFDHAMRLGLFGSPLDMPEVLRGQSVKFVFESPLQAAKSKAKAGAFAQAGELLAMAMRLSPSVRHHANIDVAFRDAVQGAGAPADWLVPEDRAREAIEAEQQQQAAAAQQAQQLQAVSAVSGVAQQAGAAAQELQAAGVG